MAGIVVGTDGSAAATEAVRRAAALAATQDALLHVVVAHRREPAAASRVLDEAARVAAAAGVEGARRVKLHAADAEPAAAICLVAEHEAAELIVVGNRGLPFGGRSVCEQVRRRTSRAVLVVDTEPYWRPVLAADEQVVDVRPGRIPREWKVLLVTIVAVFMALLDVTIVNVAFPSIQADFPRTPLSDLSWVLNAYNVVFAALLVPAGRLADRIGRRRLFFAGLWTFLLGSVLCGMAPSPELLVAARIVQAAGAAALIPTSLGLLLPEFAPEKRAAAVSLWAAAGAVAAAAGPSLGSMLVDAGGWRWAFYVNVVIALGVIPGRRLLVERRDREAVAAADLLGGGLLATGVGLLALGVVKAPDWGWGDPRVLACWGAALILGGALLTRSRRHPSPILEPELLAITSFGRANVAMFLFSAGFYALLLCNVLFLTQVWGYSVIEAGFGVTPGPLAAAVAAAVAGRVSETRGPRGIAVAGALASAAACLLYATATGGPADYAGTWLPAQIVSGAAAGMVFAALSTATVMDLPGNRLATGTALSSCFRQVGAVLGIAVLIAVLGTPSPAEAAGAFQDAWSLMVVTGLAAAAAAARLPARRPGTIADAAPLHERVPDAYPIPGFERREAILHGRRMAYQTAGEGEPILLIHGLLDSSRTWRKVAPALALGHRVIVPDLFGHGLSEGPSDADYSLGGHVGALRDLLDQLGVDRVNVVGHSLGGGVALAFAYLLPDRVTRLALVSSGGLGRELSPVLRAATVPGAGPLLRTLGSRPPVLMLDAVSRLAQRLGARRVARVVNDARNVLEGLGQAGTRGAFLRTARSVIDARGQKATACALFGAYRGLDVLVLHGTRDRVIPVAHAEAVRELHPDAEVVLLDGVGHSPQLAQASFVAESIGAFVGPSRPPATTDGIEGRLAVPAIA